MITRDQEEFALQDLRRSRAAVDKLVAPASGGVYAIFLRSPGLLAPFVEGDDGLIYIGSSSNLADREFEQHFSSKSTGFSTLRRSVGALLRSVLVLKAIPRAPGPSETNVRNYRFEGDGEGRLTNWMREHLEVSVHASANYIELEGLLIPKLRPLLNLNKWPNPNGLEIKCRRKACADEARLRRQTGNSF